MRIHVLSDLHLECNMMHVPVTDADAVILAGDIWEGGLRGIEWAMTKWPLTPVIYVPGNHEFYGTDIDLHRKELRSFSAEFQNLLLLDSVGTVIKDVAFFGVTLWTDFLFHAQNGDAVAHHASLAEAARCIPDYHEIEVDGRKLRPEDTSILFNIQHNQLRRVLSCSDDALKTQLNAKHIRKRVVITHHAPSARSVHAKYASSTLTSSFASRIDETVMLADVWIHGHTHDSCDYVMKRADGHETRVVCNPRGYSKGRKNENSRFNQRLVIEV